MAKKVLVVFLTVFFLFAESPELLFAIENKSIDENKEMIKLALLRLGIPEDEANKRLTLLREDEVKSIAENQLNFVVSTGEEKPGEEIFGGVAAGVGIILVAVLIAWAVIAAKEE